MPRGAEANSDLLTGAVASEAGGTGYFNVVVDADGVVRRVPLATLPYGLDPDRANWDMYASDRCAGTADLSRPPKVKTPY